MFKKGDIVVCDRYVTTGINLSSDIPNLYIELKVERGNVNNQKNLYSIVFKDPSFGIVIGQSYLATGIYFPCHGHDYDFEPAVLEEDKRHIVLVVEPLRENSQRYLKPFYSLERYVYPKSYAKELRRKNEI